MILYRVVYFLKFKRHNTQEYHDKYVAALYNNHSRYVRISSITIISLNQQQQYRHIPISTKLFHHYKKQYYYIISTTSASTTITTTAKSSPPCPWKRPQQGSVPHRDNEMRPGSAAPNNGRNSSQWDCTGPALGSVLSVWPSYTNWIPLDKRIPNQA